MLKTEKNQIIEFLSRLHRGGTYAYYWTKSDSKKLSHWYRVEDQELPPSYDGVDVYFSVHPTNSIPDKTKSGKPTSPEYVRSRIDIIESANCVFAEFDAKDFDGGKEDIIPHINSLPLEPTAVVDSGGGYHAYWLFDSPVYFNNDEERNEFSQLQWRWVKFTGGDDGAKDLARILRLPGTVNHKYDSKPIVEFIWNDGPVYSLEEIERECAVKREDRAEKEIIQAKNQREYEKPTREELEEALKYIPSYGDYNDWVNVLMGIHSVFPNHEGVEIAENWSPGFNGEVAKKFASFSTNGNGNGKVGAGSIFRMAKQNGWKKVSYGNEDALTMYPKEGDYGNAYAANELIGYKYIHADAWGWMNWTGTHWESNGAEAAMYRDITEVLRKRRAAGVMEDNEDLVKAAKPSATNVRNAAFHFKNMRQVSDTEFDEISHLLNVKNGVINLRTGELSPHSPSDRFSYCVPVEYDPNADAPVWRETLRQIFSNDKEIIYFMQQALGYAITGETREECMFYLYGPRGRNGKGTIINTVSELLENPMAQSVSFDVFAGSKWTDPQNFRLAPLHNARLIAAGEGSEIKLNESVVKNVTGNDTLQVAFKGKTAFDMKPKFKVFLMSNHQVKGDVDDDAFWGRVRLVEFPNSFYGKEDKYLKSKLRLEYSGILNWLVQGAVSWYKYGLIIPQSVEDAKLRHREEYDDVKRFMNECLVESDRNEHLDNVYSSYKEWAEENGIRHIQSKVWVARKLREKGCEISRVTVDGKKYRILQGYKVIT